MITDNREYSATLERIDLFRRQVMQLREVVSNPNNYRASVSGFLAEIDRMQRDVREYLSLHPSEIAKAA